ncbi:MAG: hypothetical protein AB7K24_22855 [Gemmataceae bacterium]
MYIERPALEALLVIYLQVALLSGLFVLAGMWLYRRVLTGLGETVPLSFACGGAYFLGMAAFLVLFMVYAHLFQSARVGLWLSIGSLLVMGLLGHAWSWAQLASPHVGKFLLSAAALVCAFTVTNMTCWFQSAGPGPTTSPGHLTMFGSGHSGRYGNYSIYIAEADRIPAIAQNLGQSMLAAANLLLGCDSPLAALMVWIPFSLTGMTLLIYGLFRLKGLSTAWAIGGTYFVLFCQVALSFSHVLVLDTGSPIGFSCYTDAVVCLSTFLLTWHWCETLLFRAAPWSWWNLLFPLLFGVYWSWSAPQNIVISLATVLGVMLIRGTPAQADRSRRRLVLAAIVLVGATAVGASQAGVFLPRSLREEINSPKYEVPVSSIRFRPYLQYLHNYWTSYEWNLHFDSKSSSMTPRVYEKNYEINRSKGKAVVISSTLRVLESHLWSALRVYGFLFLGLGLLAWRVYWAPSELRGPLDSWLWGAASAALTGFLIMFCFDIGGVKWHLTRFMLPGVVLCLTGLVLALAPCGTTPASRRLQILWGVLLIVGTLAPWFDWGQQFWASWVTRAAVDPLYHRVNLLIREAGPYP